MLNISKYKIGAYIQKESFNTLQQVESKNANHVLLRLFGGAVIPTSDGVYELSRVIIDKQKIPESSNRAGIITALLKAISMPINFRKLLVNINK